MRPLFGPIIVLVSLLAIMALGSCQSSALAVPKSAVLSRDETGELLFKAVKVNDVLEVKRLLELGADPDFEAKDGHVCILAARKGNLDVLGLLGQYGADINIRDLWGNTPISVAVKFDHVTVVEMMLDQGIDVNSKDGRDSLLLQYAALGNQTDMAKLLITRGAEVNLAGAAGFTPLHNAAYNNSQDVSELLIEAGARLDPLSDDGETPLQVALRRRSDDVAHILREAGAE